MSDDWDDDAPSSGTAFSSSQSSAPLIGVTFGGRGRGFIPADSGRGGRGGFSRGGGGGDRGGRSFGDRPRRNNDDERNGNDSRRDGGGYKKFGGEGGDGGGFKKFGGGSGEENGETNGEPEKPKAQTYVPPELTDNEDELYRSTISSGINFKKYDDIPFKVSGEDVPPGIKTFQESGLRKFLIEKVEKCGYTVPTPIQKLAIPAILKQRDVMACAQTGSGKTAAFLLPIIHNLLANPEESIEGEQATPLAVIMSPTRELAVQIMTEAKKFTVGSAIIPCVVYGGTQVGHQIGKLMNGCHILVATPGRLMDFVERKRISFHKIRFIVLDEADRMLDMGFQPAIDKMINHETMVSKTERQTLMFSATFPEAIQDMAKRYLNRYLFIVVGIVGGACSDVQQRFIQITRAEKLSRVVDIVNESGVDRTVIFVETKRLADFLAISFSERDIPTTSIHGDREQYQREEALRDFRSGKMKVLIATAVASRGLDIKNVGHVINYDLPKEADEYVHRIGRTGRLGNRGLATSFFDEGTDGNLAPHLVKFLEDSQQEVPDFLLNASGGRSADAGHNSSGFGAHDTRKGRFNSAPQASNQQVDEEAWD